nr:hypothetical protein [Paenibacillus senegalimassiliensis]
MKFKLYSALVLLFILSACTTLSGTISADDVISKFKNAGLEAENVTDVKADDMG